MNAILQKNFSDALKRARGNRSQAEFARVLGIPSQQTYQRYEGGLIPGGAVLHKIASCLGVTIDELLAGGKKEDKAVLSRKDGDLPVPWGFELEQGTQMTVAIAIIAKCMHWKQLLAATQAVYQSKVLNDKSKVFWGKILGEWAAKLKELEEYLKLSPKEKIAVIERRQKDHFAKAELAPQPLLDQESRQLKEFFETRRTPNGLYMLRSQELEAAVKAGLECNDIRVVVSTDEKGKPLNPPVEKELVEAQMVVMEMWRVYWQVKRSGCPISEPPHLNADGSVPKDAQSQLDAFTMEVTEMLGMRKAPDDLGNTRLNDVLHTNLRGAQGYSEWVQGQGGGEEPRSATGAEKTQESSASTGETQKAMIEKYFKGPAVGH